MAQAPQPIQRFGLTLTVPLPSLNKDVIAAVEQREFNKHGDPADDGRSDVDSIDSDDYTWLEDMDFMYEVIMTRPSNQEHIDTSNLIE